MPMTLPTVTSRTSPGLRIGGVRAKRTPRDDEEVGCEVAAGDQHESDADRLDRRRIEKAETRVVAGEAAEPHGR
jgi:hypothetical protein